MAPVKNTKTPNTQGNALKFVLFANLLAMAAAVLYLAIGVLIRFDLLQSGYFAKLSSDGSYIATLLLLVNSGLLVCGFGAMAFYSHYRAQAWALVKIAAIFALVGGAILAAYIFLLVGR